MMKIRPRWIVLLGSLAAVALAFWFLPQKMKFWASGDEGEAAPKWDRPTTAVVSSRNISFAISAAGEITPAEQVIVRPEVSGRIDQLPVEIGDRIKAGEMLFALDDTDLQTEKAQREIEIGGASLQAAGAQLSTQRAELNFNRTQELHEQKLLSQEVFDNDKLELDVARNNYAITNNNLERSKKSLQLVEDKLAKTKITAPFDCTILTRSVSIGQAVSGASGVNSGTEVMTVADLSELVVNAHINQADVTRISVNQRVEIEVEAVPGLKLIGRVALIGPIARIVNGIKGFPTKIIVKNDGSTGVRPGMTANLTIPLQSADNVLAVPIAAVFTDQGSRFTYVKQGDKFVRTPIIIGVSDYDFAEVTKGLSGGEVVSLVTPAGDAGKAQQDFGAAAKGGKGGDGEGKRPGGTRGGPPTTSGGGSRGTKSPGGGGKRGSG